MEILCLMGLYPKEYEEEITKNAIVGMQNAANKFQWGIIDGITKNENVHIKVVNSMYIGSYPRRYKRLRIPSFTFHHKPGADDINVGFTNITGYKAISRYFTVKREINKWAESVKDHQAVVLAYAMTTPFVEILNYVKKKYPGIKCCLVVPDLPEYMNASSLESTVYRAGKKIQLAHFRRQLKPIDGYVLLTKYMEEWFNWEIRYTVIEGISLKTEEELKAQMPLKKRKSILYAGMIEKKYGVLDLAKSFHEIDAADWTLDLYGNGSALEEIRQLASIDRRIVIHGFAPNAEVLKAQKESEILINPRNDNYDFTKYSFPSKVIEYLGSGTPMIGYILPGMPKEYHDKFYVVSKKDNGLKECMQRVMALSSAERAEQGQKALEFIVREKNTGFQGNKIVDFLMTL